MDYQNAFDTAYNGLKTQGELAYAGHGCFFHDHSTPNITCAVGQLVNPEDRERLESAGIGGVHGMDPSDNRWSILTSALSNGGFPIRNPKDDVDFLAAIQDAHDFAATNQGGVGEALDRLKVVAARYALTVPA